MKDSTSYANRLNTQIKKMHSYGAGNPLTGDKLCSLSCQKDTLGDNMKNF